MRRLVCRGKRHRVKLSEADSRQRNSITTPAGHMECLNTSQGAHCDALKTSSRARFRSHATSGSELSPLSLDRAAAGLGDPSKIASVKYDLPEHGNPPRPDPMEVAVMII